MACMSKNSWAKVSCLILALCVTPTVASRAETDT